MLIDRVSAALYNISIANVRAMRRAMLDDAWQDAAPGGFKLPDHKRRQEQQEERLEMLMRYPKWKAPSYEPDDS